MRLTRVVAVAVAAVLAGVAPAVADESDEFSIAEYLGMRAEMVRADEALSETAADSVERTDATRSMVVHVAGLVEYLNRWLASGSMPADVRGEAITQRYVYFENLVQLHVALGDCLASRSALEAMRALEPEMVGEEYADLLRSAEDVSATCRQRPWVAALEAPEPVDHHDVHTMLWASGAMLIVAGAVVTGAYADERSELEELQRSNTVLAPARVVRRERLDGLVTRSRRVTTALASIGGGLVISGVVAHFVEVTDRNRWSTSVARDGVHVAYRASW